MNFFFESSSWIFNALLVVIAAILLCFGALWIVRRNISVGSLRKHHDVAGFTFSIIGVLYGVILGFTVINVQDRYNDVEKTVHTEALLLADLYQDAAFFSNDECRAIRTSLRQYTDYVIKKEWKQSGKKSLHLQTRNFLKEILENYNKVNLKDEKANLWYTESISKLNAFMNARLERLFSSWDHLSGMMWTLLIIGSIITICFMFFFELENVRSHMLMTALLVGYLSFLLYLIYSLDHLFSGPQALKPIALQEVYDLFDQWDKDLPGR